MRELAAVIPAAGHGSFDGRTPKLLEEVGGRAILVRVVEALKAAGCEPIVVVINRRFGPQIQNHLDQKGHNNLRYAFQPERRGAAEAVNRALPVLQQWGTENFLVILDEMLFMDPGTIQDLIACHFRHQADFSLLTCPFRADHPLCSSWMRDYAFLARDYEADHPSIPFLFMYSGKAPEEEAQVIGSLYVFRRDWFAEMYPEIKPMDKGDGSGPEYHLPPLIELAVLKSAQVVNLTQFKPRQVLGVNTPSQLEMARKLARLL